MRSVAAGMALSQKKNDVSERATIGASEVLTRSLRRQPMFKTKYRLEDIASEDLATAAPVG